MYSDTPKFTDVLSLQGETIERLSGVSLLHLGKQGFPPVCNGVVRGLNRCFSCLSSLGVSNSGKELGLSRAQGAPLPVGEPWED